MEKLNNEAAISIIKTENCESCSCKDNGKYCNICAYKKAMDALGETYVFSITYNFNGDYICKSFHSFEDASKELRKCLSDEVNEITENCGYVPSVLEFAEDDIVLVYADMYTKDNILVNKTAGRNYALEDCAYYRIFKL